MGMGMGMGVGMVLRVGILIRLDKWKEMKRHEVGACNFQSLCHHYIIPLATYRRPTGDLQATYKRLTGEMLKPRTSSVLITSITDRTARLPEGQVFQLFYRCRPARDRHYLKVPKFRGTWDKSSIPRSSLSCTHDKVSRRTTHGIEWHYYG